MPPSSSTPGPGAATAPPPTAPLPVAGSDATLATLPSPLIALLLILAGPLRVLKKSIEVLTWRSASPVDSWLVVAGWWAVCLGGRAVYKYILPPLLLLLIPFPSSLGTTSGPRSTLSRLIASIPFHHAAPVPSLTTSGPTTSPRTPGSSNTVLLALADLYAINAMLAAFPIYLGAPGRRASSTATSGGISAWVWGEGDRWWAQMERRRLIRGGVVLWATWVALNWALGARVTLSLVGSAMLLLPSPTLRALQQLLAKSLFLRRLATTIFLVVFGSPPNQPLRFEIDAAPAPSEPFSVRKWLINKWRTSRRPSFALRLRPPVPAIALSGSASGSALADDADDALASDPVTAPCPPVYFRFELQENQRWWMGLDWTSALLPQERPSWCDVYLAPVSPPSSFVLPGESVMYLPVPGREGARTKRTARWRWLDEDWTVVRRTAGGNVGAQGGKDPSAGGGKHERSASFSTGHGPDSTDVFGAGEHKSTTKGLAEQAFVKGLEKLKARNILGSGSNTPQGPSAGGVASGQANAQTPSSPTSSSMASTFAVSVGFGTGIMGGAAGSPARNRASMDETRPRSRDSSTEDTARRHSAHPDAVSPPPGMGGAQSATLAGHLVNGTTAHGVTVAGSGGTTAVAAGLAALMHDLDVQTDNDGWSYGDNKWEGMGPKGGLGRYTRRRRWQRTAICSETVEYIPAPAEAAAIASASTTPKAQRRTSFSSAGRPAPPVLADVVSPKPDAAGYAVDAPATIIPPSHGGVVGGERKLRTSSASSERDQMLRQRLRNAMGSVGA